MAHTPGIGRTIGGVDCRIQISESAAFAVVDSGRSKSLIGVIMRAQRSPTDFSYESTRVTEREWGRPLIRKQNSTVHPRILPSNRPFQDFCNRRRDHPTEFANH